MILSRKIYSSLVQPTPTIDDVDSTTTTVSPPEASFELDPDFAAGVCAGATHGARAAIPISCNYYVVCLEGGDGSMGPRVMACPEERQFDRDVLVCDTIERAGCVPWESW